MNTFAERVTKIGMTSSGYSGTPLAKKLGIKSGQRLRLINAPSDYLRFFSDFPEGVTVVDTSRGSKDVIHYFATSAQQLATDLEALKNEIEPNGAIWISWYKKAAKIPTDVTEDFIRGVALSKGLVDIKVCAVSELWSGLKLVIPVRDRKPSC